MSKCHYLTVVLADGMLISNGNAQYRLELPESVRNFNAVSLDGCYCTTKGPRQPVLISLDLGQNTTLCPSKTEIGIIGSTVISNNSSNTPFIHQARELLIPIYTPYCTLSLLNGQHQVFVSTMLAQDFINFVTLKFYNV
jgi:hypothetical protein